VILGLGLFYLYTTDFILNPFLSWWEVPMVWYKDLPNDYEAAIVLGGMSAPGKMPNDRTHFPGTPDRLLHAMQLYKLGKVKKIVISGGSGELVGKRIPEAEYLKRVLLLCEVNDKNIIIDDRSRNTHENATISLEIAKKYFKSDSKFLLVTSAWHMRRAVACYEKVGMNVTGFSVDSMAKEPTLSIYSFIPNLGVPGRWHAIIHELLGYLSYRIFGYV